VDPIRLEQFEALRQVARGRSGMAPTTPATDLQKLIEQKRQELLGTTARVQTSRKAEEVPSSQGRAGGVSSGIRMDAYAAAVRGHQELAAAPKGRMLGNFVDIRV